MTEQSDKEFEARRIGGAFVPTGWPRVDRIVGDLRNTLASASAEEDFQTVGLKCREALISLAQTVFDPAVHSTLDGVKASDTDAKRMLEAYIVSAHRGGENEQIRKHARSALDVAVALQHKRTATLRDASLCAEATTSVVNLIAILTSRPGAEMLGSSPPPETLVARAKRLGQSRAFKEERERFRKSELGVQTGQREHQALLRSLTDLFNAISESEPSLKFRIQTLRGVFVVIGLNLVMTVNWHCFYSNVLDDHALEIEVLDRVPRDLGGFPYEEPRYYQRAKYEIDLEAPGTAAWKLRDTDGRFYRTDTLAEHLVKQFLDLSEKVTR